MRFFPFACAALVAVAHPGFAQQSTSETPSAPSSEATSVRTDRPVERQQPAAGARDTQDEKQVSLAYVPSLRLDLIAGSVTAVHAGASILIPVSNYFGFGGTVGAGISEEGFSGRGDLFGRVSLDPYRQYSWEPYVGGGATVRMDSGGPGTRTYFLAFVGVNGPRTGKISPGFEFGFGGGVRLGVTLRWAK